MKRREVLQWTAPVITAVLLPAHAQMSPPLTIESEEQRPRREPDPPDPKAECLARDGAWWWDDEAGVCMPCESPYTGAEGCQAK